MKKQFVFISIMLITISAFAQNKKFQKYNVETGKIAYKAETKKENIIRTVVFKDWGATEYVVETTKTFKSKKKNKLEKEETTVILFDKDYMYTVDEEEKKILQMKNIAAVMFQNKNVAVEGERIAEFNGGEKIGEEKILGYLCDKWTLKGIKSWVYKGINLKLVSNRETEIATSAEFNIVVTKDDIVLPNYPVISLNPFQPVEDTVAYYQTQEGQEEVVETVEDTGQAYEDAKIMEWDDWYKIHKNDKQFKDSTITEIKAFYDESRKTVQDRVDERVEERVNDRINDRINHRIQTKKRGHIRRHTPW
jgi:hypothetical protein